MPENLLTRTELAKQLDRNRQTITKWTAAGMPVAKRGSRGKPHLYRVSVVLAWLAARDEIAKSGQALDLTQQRARKELAQALLAEQKCWIPRRPFCVCTARATSIASCR